MTKLVQVAAAVIQRPDGAFLLGQRAPGTFYPGYWEFPGGKVEPGESAQDALVRELREELGMDVLEVSPWITRRHVYEHAHVCLNFFRVSAWRGELREHVHSALSWQADPLRLSVGPMLPANGPILRALALPDFYALTQAQQIGVDAQLARLESALTQGLKLLQIREPDMPAQAFSQFATQALALAHAHGAQALIHGDVAMAMTLGADGVHLPARQLMALNTRPTLPLVAASCHNREELEQAARLELDFAVLGNVLNTASHPDRAPLGWQYFAEAVADLPMPVFALGGLSSADTPMARRQGGQGVAAQRAAWLA